VWQIWSHVELFRSVGGIQNHILLIKDMYQILCCFMKIYESVTTLIKGCHTLPTSNRNQVVSKQHVHCVVWDGNGTVHLA